MITPTRGKNPRPAVPCLTWLTRALGSWYRNFGNLSYMREAKTDRAYLSSSYACFDVMELVHSIIKWSLPSLPYCKNSRFPYEENTASPIPKPNAILPDNISTPLRQELGTGIMQRQMLTDAPIIYHTSMLFYHRREN